MKKLKYITPLLLSLFFAFILNSCSNHDPITPAGQPSASVSMVGGEMPNTMGLTITGAKFLVQSVELEKERGSGAASLKFGPFVVTLNLTGTPIIIALNNVAPGTYKAVSFVIHAHNPNEVVIDPDFGTNGPGLSGIITGTFNGNPFTYRTNVNTKPEVDITPPAVVLPVGTSADPLGSSNTGAVNVSMVVEASNWFVSSGHVLNPMDPANQDLINQNIIHSFAIAFPDNNHDGQPDPAR